VLRPRLAVRDDEDSPYDFSPEGALGQIAPRSGAPGPARHAHVANIRALGALAPDRRRQAARADRFSDRRLGKLHCALASLGPDMVRQSLVLTDCLQDRALLEACALPLRTLWPGARFRHALSNVYLPGLYLARIKRPGSRYFRRAVLQEDFVFWVLGSLVLAVHPILHVVALFLLLVSFWALYERGYMDSRGLREETDTQCRVLRGCRSNAAVAAMGLVGCLGRYWDCRAAMAGRSERAGLCQMVVRSRCNASTVQIVQPHLEALARLAVPAPTACPNERIRRTSTDCSDWRSRDCRPDPDAVGTVLHLSTAWGDLAGREVPGHVPHHLLPHLRGTPRNHIWPARSIRTAW